MIVLQDKSEKTDSLCLCTYHVMQQLEINMCGRCVSDITRIKLKSLTTTC